ncbi:TetR/AcrR family transcriptional regulator [Erythrobacter sp. R86502]|uniref:TetR/AcrR family transcriptional regulator n=1 Tax=Erythrobacter sp. R86502 TaxID=3093846 RepID=UPI0036D354C1
MQLSRETLLPKLAAHVLEHGLGGASLRPLAKAAGTSDRMLIYHFGNKETLIVELLGYLAALYSAALDTALAGEPVTSRQECLTRILAEGTKPEMQAFLVLWWDIVAGSARGVPGYRDAARQMMARLLAWLEGQMPADDPDPAGGARYLMTLIEGALMLAAVGHEDTAQQGLLAGGLLQA